MSGAGGPRRVGFVGLGAMGMPMSGHLLAAGWRVLGHDLSDAAVDRHAARGGEPAGPLGEIGRTVDVVVTSLPSAAALAAVLEGLDGTGRELPLVVVETSTLSLPEKLSAHEAARARGVVLLDCPISGTSAQAQTRDLAAYLSGGPQWAVDAALVVLADMVRSTHAVGEFGNGTRLKLVANLLVGVHNLAAAEALLLAQQCGLDLGAVLPALLDGAGQSRMLAVRGPLMLQESYEEATVRVEIFQKDLTAIRALAASCGSPTPLLSVTSAFYDAASAQGRGQQDTACAFGVLRGLAAPRLP